MKKIAVLGPKNTYSDLCHLAFNQLTHQNISPKYYQNVKDVLLGGKSLGYAILPIENTLEGYVQPHMDLLFSSGLSIDAEIKLPIEFNYVYKKDAKHIYVQYVTKNQCILFLDKNTDKKIILTDSNVESYDAYLSDPEGAAIVPKHLVKKSDLSIPNVSDELDNYTRFLMLKGTPHELKIYKGNEPYKVSLVVTPKEDRPGLLYGILEAFKEANINLISIMSRPTKKKMGTYHFFLEFMVNLDKNHVVNEVFSNLKSSFEIKVLGMYQIL